MQLTRHSFLEILLAGAAGLMATPALAADSLAAIRQKKAIRIGVATDFPPYGFVGADLRPQGSDVDTAHLVADRLGVKLDLVPVTTPNRIANLESGKIDMIIAVLGKTPDREKVLDFTIAYAPFYSGIFGPRSAAIKSYADLAGQAVGVTRGSIQDHALDGKLPAGAEVRRFEDDAATVAAFTSGQVPFVAMSASLAGVTLAKNPQLGAEYKLLLTDIPCYIGVRKGDTALLEATNRILRAARADGTLGQISWHWLGRPPGNLPD